MRHGHFNTKMRHGQFNVSLLNQSDNKLKTINVAGQLQNVKPIVQKKKNTNWSLSLT